MTVCVLCNEEVETVKMLDVCAECLDADNNEIVDKKVRGKLDGFEKIVSGRHSIPGK